VDAADERRDKGGRRSQLIQVFADATGAHMWGPVDGPLTHAPLNLSWVLSSEPGHWKGVVQCDIDLVGVTLALQGGVVHWSKSRQLPAGAFVVGEPMTGFPVAFWIGRALEDEAPGRTNLALYLRGAVRATMVGEVSSATPFEIMESAEGTTGEAICVVRLGTTPPTECGFLFLARSDVRTSRKGLWRVRPTLAGELTGVIGSILGDGRSGEARVLEQADGADEAQP
jgi:hypothetical protein